MASGGIGRIEWVAIGRLQLELEGGVIIPFEKNAIVLSSPRIPLYSLPGFGGMAAAGVGMHFL
jgi:hypothetical protein